MLKIPSVEVFYSLVSTLIKMLSSLLVVAIYSHALSVSDYAVLITGLFFAQLASIFIDGGINNELLASGSNECGQTIDERMALTSAIRFCLYTITAMFFSFYYILADGLYMGAIFFCGFMSSALGLITETYSIRLKTQFYFKIELILTVIVCLLVVVFSLLSLMSPFLLFVSLLLPRCISLFVYKEPVKLFASIGKVGYKSILNSFGRLKYFSIDSITSNFNMQLDSIFVLLLLGRDVYAIYQPLNKMYQSCIGLSSAISSYVIPKVSLLQENKQRLVVLFKYYFAFSFVVVLSYYFLSCHVVTILFGAGFSTDISVIFALSLLMFVRYLAAAFGAFLMLNSRQKSRARINLLMTVLAVPLLSIMNDYFSVVITVVVSQTVILILYVLASKNILREVAR